MVTRRHVEVGTGLSAALVGAVIAYGSLENGIGWTEFGPAAGYFPFRIGMMVVVLGVVIALRYGLSGRRRAPAGANTHVSGPAAMEAPTPLDERFIDREQFGRIASVFVPTAVSAALYPWLGVYLASVLFLVFTMMTLGKVSLLKSLSISLGVMAAFFAMFEWWFLVPLDKGVLMPLVGIY